MGLVRMPFFCCSKYFSNVEFTHRNLDNQMQLQDAYAYGSARGKNNGEQL